jgi:hypothetical protein
MSFHAVGGVLRNYYALSGADSRWGECTKEK